MGFTTRNKEAEASTFQERKDVEKWVHEFAEEQGWDLSDVRNRAIMWYATKYKNDELDDPMVDNNTDSRPEL